MLLMRHVAAAWPRLPAWAWARPGVAAWMAGPMGRGLLLGAGLAMALAALGEVWELVDLALLRIARPGGGER
jgi:transketolase